MSTAAAVVVAANITVIVASTFTAAPTTGAVARLLGKVLDQGRESGDAGDDDADCVFNNGPLDGPGGVEVVFEAADGLDADDLDDGDEDAEGEEAEKDEFLA